LEKGVRSLFTNMFGKKNEGKVLQNTTSFKLINDGTNVQSNPGGSMYDNDTVRSCVHTIASHCGRLKPSHIRRVDDKIVNTSSNLDWTLRFKPNRYMNSYDYIYKIVTRLLLDNNAFVYVNYLGSGNYEFFPINYANIELIESAGELYCKFMFHGGQYLTVLYDEVLHFRRHFSDSDFFGSPMSTALSSLVDLTANIDEGITETINNDVRIRGILKFQNSMLKKEDLKAQRDTFVEEYLDIENSGGLAAIDSKAEFIQLENKSISIIDAALQEHQKKRIYDFFNINEDIIQAKNSPEIYQSFYESTVEPIALQLSLEHTNKTFTDGELNHGNEIYYSANRLQFSNTVTKIALARDLMPLGLFSKNEIREIFNLAPIEGGDKFIQTLNVIDASKANEYQMGKKKGVTKDEDI